MDTLQHLRHLLQYDRWANQEALRSLGHAAPPSRVLKILAHIAAAEDLWLARLTGSKSGAVWPVLTLAQCGDYFADVSRRFEKYLQDLPPAQLTKPVAYTNSKGEPWTSTVQDIVTHVVLHSAYHRGQVASETRNAGQEPAYTDYIHCVRQGFV